LGQIDTKFAQFSHFASAAKNFVETINAIRASGYFDKNQFIDYELLALIFCV